MGCRQHWRGALAAGGTSSCRLPPLCETESVGGVGWWLPPAGWCRQPMVRPCGFRWSFCLALPAVVEDRLCWWNGLVAASCWRVPPAVVMIEWLLRATLFWRLPSSRRTAGVGGRSWWDPPASISFQLWRARCLVLASSRGACCRRVCWRSLPRWDGCCHGRAAAAICGALPGWCTREALAPIVRSCGCGSPALIAATCCRVPLAVASRRRGGGHRLLVHAAIAWGDFCGSPGLVGVTCRRVLQAVASRGMSW